MTKKVHGLDVDGKPISMTFAGDCTLFIDGGGNIEVSNIQADEEWALIASGAHHTETIDWIGPRPKK